MQEIIARHDQQIMAKTTKHEEQLELLRKTESLETELTKCKEELIEANAKLEGSQTTRDEVEKLVGLPKVQK